MKNRDITYLTMTFLYEYMTTRYKDVHFPFFNFLQQFYKIEDIALNGSKEFYFFGINSYSEVHQDNPKTYPQIKFNIEENDIKYTIFENENKVLKSGSLIQWKTF